MDDVVRIVIVEDDESIREVVEYALQDAGYLVQAYERGDVAMEALESELPDLLILDLMLPGLPGLEICRKARARSASMPIIILSARDEEIDRILGLEIGADDYVVKPFSPRELISRVRAHLRRRTAEHRDDATEGGILTVGDLEVDPGARIVTRAGQVIPLTYSEFEILLKLVRAPHTVLRREDLVQWQGPAHYGDLRSVDVHIRHLRQKLEEEPAIPRRIRTVRGVGYSLHAPDDPLPEE